VQQLTQRAQIFFAGSDDPQLRSDFLRIIGLPPDLVRPMRNPDEARPCLDAIKPKDSMNG
jgi:hypothetical protein